MSGDKKEYDEPRSEKEVTAMCCEECVEGTSPEVVDVELVTVKDEKNDGERALGSVSHCEPVLLCHTAQRVCWPPQ